MKKFVLLYFCGMMFSFNANAAYPDLTPLSDVAPQVCAPCTSEKVQMYKSAYETVKSVSSREGLKQKFGEVEAHAKKYALDKGKDFVNNKLKKKKNKDDNKPISYTRVIKKTKTDVEDVNAVKDSFKKYFLYVPSKNEEIQASYKEKREQFVEDTTIELYIISKEMDKELKVMISQLDLIKKCVIEGDDEECKNQGLEEYNCQKDEGAEDEMCYRRNMLMVAQIYDTIMKYNEYLIAMRSQYEAVRAIGSSVKPEEPADKKSKTTSLSNYIEDTVGYASEEIDDEPLVVEKLPDSEFDFVDNNKTGAKTPLADKQDDIKAMAVFEEAQQHISNAFESHNLKQQLPEFKRVFDTYHNMEKMHAKAVENLQASEQCVVNYLNKRYPNNGEKVWLDNCVLDEGDGYVCKYSPSKSATDTAESEGLYDVLCPDNPSQKCYKLAPTAYNEIGGMSGWLINMYLNAKDELSDDVPDSENYVVAAASTDAPQDRNIGPGTGAYSAEYLKKQIENGDILMDTYKEKMRVLSRLPYSIGVLANNEINKDTNGTGGKSKFGVETVPFKLWNDQINFYDQYIDGKYENIEAYLENAPMFENMLNLGLKINETYEYEAQRDASGMIAKSVEAIRKEVAEAINALLGQITDDSQEKVALVDKLLLDEDEKLNQILSDYHEKLEDLDKKRFALYKQLEDINIKTAETHEEITKQDAVINYAEGYNAVAEKGAEMDKDYQNPENPHKTNEAVFNENIAEQQNKEASAESARDVAINQLNTTSSSRDEVLNAIIAVEREIIALKHEYVLAYFNAESKYKTDIEDIVRSTEISNTAKIVSEAKSSFIVLQEAEMVMKLIRDYAVKQVEKAYTEIDKLKKDKSIYYAENNPKVVAIHSEMMKKITDPKVEDIVAELQLDDTAKTLLTKYASMITGVFSDICDETTCYEPDKEYFVGLIEQKKDFAAPKAAVEFSSAPMREVFSFGLEDMNYVDYYATKDFKLDADMQIMGVGEADISTDDAKILLLNRSLLDSGVEMPEIWKIVLSHRPFVQKEIDFRKFLGNPVDDHVEVQNSGIYPCKSGDEVITVQNAKNATYALGNAGGYDNIPQCQTIVKDGGKYFDREAPTGKNEISVGSQAVVLSNPTSELGQILEYKEILVNRIGADGLPLTDQFGTMVLQKNISYLTLNESLLYALKYLASIKDENDINEKYYFYKRVLPQNSQFGDYLMKVDLERAALEAKEKIKNKIYSANVTDMVIVNSLYKSFSEMGYDFDRNDFDLSKEDYYKQAENLLNARKEDNIRQAKAILAENEGLNLTSDEMVKRKEDLLKQISLLELDSEELIQINGPETIDEVAEEIKVQKTDAAVRELASKIDEGEKELAERIKNSAPAYCSSYGEF